MPGSASGSTLFLDSDTSALAPLHERAAKAAKPSNPSDETLFMATCACLIHQHPDNKTALLSRRHGAVGSQDEPGDKCASRSLVPQL